MTIQQHVRSNINSVLTFSFPSSPPRSGTYSFVSLFSSVLITLSVTPWFLLWNLVLVRLGLLVKCVLEGRSCLRQPPVKIRWSHFNELCHSCKFGLAWSTEVVAGLKLLSLGPTPIWKVNSAIHLPALRRWRRSFYVQRETEFQKQLRRAKSFWCARVLARGHKGETQAHVGRPTLWPFLPCGWA